MAQRKAKKGRAGAKKRGPVRRAAPKRAGGRGKRKSGATQARPRSAGAAGGARANARIAELEAENRRLREELASLRGGAERDEMPAETGEEPGEPTLPFGE